MKRLILILLSITLFTSCDNEPLDNTVLNTGNGGGNTSDDPLALNAYSLDLDSELPFVGNLVLNTDFSFNSNNQVSNSIVASTFFGQTTTENVTFTRDNSNRITGYRSMSSGVLTNETTVTYSGNNISSIVYNYVGDDEDDYTYNFTYSGNNITRIEVGSTISTVFTLNGNNQLIRKESFDGTTSIKTEVLDYDGLGNCIASIITGEDATSSTFLFDTNDNPLKPAFRDQFQLSFLNDDYSDEVGSSMAQFASPNNWKGVTTPEGTVNFTLAYDTEDRIISRNGNYDFGDGVLIQQDEMFSFIN